MRDELMTQQSQKKSRARTKAGVAAAIALSAVMGASEASAANTIGKGYGWDPLEDLIDLKVLDFMIRNKVAGMTVAISKNGKLVLSKGYGGKHGPNGKDMSQNTRTRIGSTTKVLMTAPTAAKAMQVAGVDPKIKRIYGANSVLGPGYLGDMNWGVNRHSPIVAMAIGPKDRTYTWYLDGTYSIGSSFDLQKHQGRQSFDLPADKTPSDIVDVAIGKHRVFTTFYTDGRISRSSRPEHLGSFRVSDGKFTEVAIPGSLSILNVVGIAQAKSNNRFYFWYDDGTASSGTDADADKWRKAYSYSSGGTSRYGIRAIGISASDRVYTWSVNGNAQVGTSSDLDAHKSNYAYDTRLKGARSPNPFNWYYEMTLQDILDHRAGFQHSGDISGALKLYKTTKGSLTYDQLHRYMLRTRPLLGRPGVQRSYSNHGFGLWTLLVPKLVGSSYASYAQYAFLWHEVGISSSDVRPMRKVPDSRDATPFWVDSKGKFRAHSHQDAGIGLAAGGWTSSAGDMLRIATYLTQRYSWDELRRMGWVEDGEGAKSRLHHNGATSGGMSYITMFRPGYISNNGTDLGDIQIAVATNTSTDMAELMKLADGLAFDVPKANIAGWYNAWNHLN